MLRQGGIFTFKKSKGYEGQRHWKCKQRSKDPEWAWIQRSSPWITQRAIRHDCWISSEATPSLHSSKQAKRNAKERPLRHLPSRTRRGNHLSRFELSVLLYKQESSHIIIMSQDKLKQSVQSSNTSLTSQSTTNLSDVEVRKQRKKQHVAFKTFLDNKKDAPIVVEIPRRKLSSSQLIEEHLQSVIENCKICKSGVSEQSKVCEFCNDKVCLIHLKKRRRNVQTNKWARICEYCEDRYLNEKYLQNQKKTEESILTQELVVQTKHDELLGIVATKRIQLELLLKKKNAMNRMHKKETSVSGPLLADLDRNLAVVNESLKELSELEASLSQTQRKMPPSLQADFQILQQEDNRLRKELVKAEKQCVDLIKTRVKRQRDMYREYYQWQNKRRQEEIAEAEKESKCVIY